MHGVQYCNRLFAIEDSINQKYPGDYEKRKQLRLEKEKPVLEAFWSWLDQQKPVRNTRMDKAVNYVLNRRDTAETYLEDGRCSFTNNLSENAIRPFAVGRKNWLFSNSVEGANASAVVYTMVEMAKAHGLNIYGYLKFLLEHRPGKDMTDEQLAELAPWSEKLQSKLSTPISNGGLIFAAPLHCTGSAPWAGFADTIHAGRLLSGGPLSFEFVIFFLVSNIFPDCFLVHIADCCNVISSCPEMLISSFCSKLWMSVKQHQRAFAFQVRHEI